MKKQDKLFCILFILSIIDYCVTYIIVDKVGVVGEFNTFLKWLIQNFDIEAILGFKLLSLTLLFFVKNHISDKLYFAMSILYICIIAWGLYVFSHL